MRSIYAAAYSPSTTTNNSSVSGTSSTENLEISAVGNLMNAISQMSSSDQSSVQSFMEELTSSVQNGTFDASTMAASAPSALTSYAEENGIDLTQMVQTLADGPQNDPGVYGAPPPPPPMMGSTSGMSDTSSLDLSSLENLSSTDKSSLESFLTELTDAVNNGTFDAATMASSAPDALTTLAEANGIDLTQLIQDMADEIENNTSASSTSTASSTTAVSFPPPPPPPMMSGANGSGSSSSDDLSSILLSQFLSGNYSDSTSAAASA